MSALHQPYYVIDFKAVACKFTLLVNDVPAFSYDNAGSISSQIPINHLILRSGNQNVGYIMHPVNGQHTLSAQSHLEIKISASDAISTASQSTDIAVYKPVPVPQGNVPEIRQQYVFKAEVPYTLTGWQNGADLKNEPDIKANLINAYKKIEQVLRNKNYAEFKKVYELKSADVDKAMYTNARDGDADWDELVSYISEPGMEVKFDAAQAQLHFYGDGKLATLLKPNLEPSLYFENVKEKEEYQLPFLFYRSGPGQPLTIIR